MLRNCCAMFLENTFILALHHAHVPWKQNFVACTNFDSSELNNFFTKKKIKQMNVLLFCIDYSTLLWCVDKCSIENSIDKLCILRFFGISIFGILKRR